MRGALQLKRISMALLFLLMTCTPLGSCLAGEHAGQGRPSVAGAKDGAEVTAGQGRPSVARSMDGQRATDINHDFLEANRAYEAGEWNKAIRIYENMVADLGLSASLCYNLANSYARNGQTGKAVLEYERGLLLAPGDGDIRTNLERLRKDKGLAQEETSFLQKVGTLLGLNQWAMLAAILLMGLALFHIATLRFVVSARISTSLTGGFLLLLATCFFGVAIQYRNWQQAVIIVPDTPLLISPFEGAGTTGVIIEEGRLIRIVKRHDHYALIKDEKGRRGWISGPSFESITMNMADKENR
jgi:tetratricopeptide (TPR) repeat protein